MKKLFSLLILAGFAGHAMSANFKWTPIAESDSTSRPMIGIDQTRSFFQGKAPVIFWNDFTMGHMTSVKRPGNRPMTIYRTKIDCNNRMVSNQYTLVVEVKHFFDHSPTQYENPWSGNGQWYVPDINSAHEFVMNYACGFKN